MLSTLEKKQRIYQKIIVTEFLLEFHFLVEAASGRATPKDDFTDKLMKLVLSGLAIGSSVANIVDFTQASTAVKTGISMAVSVGMEMATQGQAQLQGNSKASGLARLGRLGDIVMLGETSENPFQLDKLRILVEEVAREAAHRYEYTLLQLSDDPHQGVIPFAKVGVERMLEYVARCNMDLKKEALLRGLIEGRSGRFVSGYQNTHLAIKNRGGGEWRAKESHFSAEGAYSRAAFLDEDKEYYALDKKNAPHKEAVKEGDWEKYKERLEELDKQFEEEKKRDLESQSKRVKVKGFLTVSPIKAFAHATQASFQQWKDSFYDYGYVHWDEKQKEEVPKYGYVNLPKTEIIQRYHYDCVLPQNSVVKTQLEQYQPSVKVLQREDIKKYLKQKGKYINLNAYVTKKYNALLAVCHADLRGLDFSGANVNGSDLSGCQFSGSLAGTNFSGAILVNTTFCEISDAKGAKFIGAHLEYAVFEDKDDGQGKGKKVGANLTGADFTQAHLHYASFQSANLSNIQSIDTQWVGANLENIVTDSKDKLLEEQQKQLLLLEKDLQRQQKQQDELNKKLQKQSIDFQTLQYKVKTNFDILNGQTKEHAEKLNKVMDDLAEEQRQRQTFQRFYQSELGFIQEQIEALEQHQKDTKARKEEKAVIENLLKELDKRAEDFLQLKEQLESVNEKINGKADKAEVESMMQALEEHVGSTIEALAKSLQGLEHRVEKLEKEVQQQNEKSFTLASKMTTGPNSTVSFEKNDDVVVLTAPTAEEANKVSPLEGLIKATQQLQNSSKKEEKITPITGELNVQGAFFYKETKSQLKINIQPSSDTTSKPISTPAPKKS